MNQISPSLKNYILLTRPKFQLPSMASMIVGLAYSLYSSSPQMPRFELIVLAALITGPFVAGGALVLNQVFDYHYDTKSAKRNLPLASGTVGIKVGAELSVVLLALGEITSLLVGMHTSIVTAFAILLSIAYSVPPLRFKARCGLDSISNGLCYGVFPTLVGWTIMLSISPRGIIMCIPLFLFFTSNHILLAIPDISDDRETKTITTAVAIGERKAVRIASLLWLLTLLVLTLYTLTGLFPYQILAGVPVMAFALFELFKLNHANLESTFNRLKLLSLVIGLIFILAFFIAIFF